MNLLEKEIRPNKLCKDMFKAIKADIKRLIGGENDFMIVSCPACDSIYYHKKFSKFAFNFKLQNIVEKEWTINTYDSSC